MPAPHYFDKVLALFRTPGSKIDDTQLVRVIQDARNYFPHFRLNGYSPAEVLAGISAVS